MSARARKFTNPGILRPSLSLFGRLLYWSLDEEEQRKSRRRRRWKGRRRRRRRRRCQRFWLRSAAAPDFGHHEKELVVGRADRQWTVVVRWANQQTDINCAVAVLLENLLREKEEEEDRNKPCSDGSLGEEWRKDVWGGQGFPPRGEPSIDFQPLRSAEAKIFWSTGPISDANSRRRQSIERTGLQSRSHVVSLYITLMNKRTWPPSSIGFSSSSFPAGLLGCWAQYLLTSSAIALSSAGLIRNPSTDTKEMDAIHYITRRRRRR